jgi:plastocyanin
MLRRPWWALVVLAIIVGTWLSALPASAGGGGICHQRDMTASTRNDVFIKDFCFKSTITRVQVGEPVTFTNKDPFAHNVVGWRADWGRVQNMKPGDSFTYRFAEPGVYPYACYLHFGMTGAVVVDEELGAGSVAAVLPGREARAERVTSSNQGIGGGTVLVGALATLAAVAAGLGLWSRRRSPATPESPAT